MKRNEETSLWTGIGFLIAFLLWTVLIRCIDVQAAGPNGTTVGFAAFNLCFHHLTGVHMTAYTITDWLGLVPIGICLCFGVIGVIQAVGRRSLLRVDPAFVKELDFVMEQNGVLIGQNMFMRTVINADDGRVIPVLTMGPIGITPELKRKGYGKKLLDYSLEKAAAMGFGAVPSRAISVSTATAALPMPGASASAITTCQRARTTPSSSAKS